MPRRRDPLAEPREYLAGDWPAGIVHPGAPLPVHYLREMITKIQIAMDESGVGRSALARMTNLDVSTLRYVLTGRNWPDMVTLVKIEQALGITVWPAWGDSALREAQDKIIALEDQVRKLRSTARKKAAAARNGGRP